VPKSEEDGDPDMRAALALSIAEEEARWPQLAAVIRTFAMEEEAQQAVKDAEAWHCSARPAGRRRPCGGVTRPGSDRRRPGAGATGTDAWQSRRGISALGRRQSCVLL
jgi:hypothetical protein